MEIKQRIDSCLSDLERKRQSVDTFQAKLRLLIESLKVDGVTPGTLADLLSALESVVQDYVEIGANCKVMVDGLREIGDHLTRIEDGRQKILNGVEAILQNLSHLDRLAQSGLQVGAGTGSAPKRILLVRISPGSGKPASREEKSEDDEDESPAGDAVIH